MCVATSIIVGSIAAGSTIAGAKMSSNASKNAAKTQKDAGDAAIAFQREQYAQARADFDPYRQAGGAALARMGAQGTTAPAAFRSGAPPVQLGTPIGSPTPAGQSGPAPPGQMAPPDAPTFRPAVMPGPRPMAPPGGPQAAGGALWTVQAPDGATKQLPPDVAEQFIARGAKRVA